LEKERSLGSGYVRGLSEKVMRQKVKAEKNRQKLNRSHAPL
jgi:hypothetical protein